MTATLRIGADWPTGLEPATLLLGVPLLRRQVLSAERAGFERIAVEPVAGTDLAPLLAGTRARVEALSPREEREERAAEPAVAISATLLPRIAWLRSLRRGDREVPGQERGFEIHAAADLPAAERWLLRGLIKEKEGFFSRHIDRKISLAISRRLASTSVTPNAMTLVSVAVGLLGAVFFLSSRVSLQVVGALLFLAHSIVDGCDGEIARLKFLESRRGGVLDFWGDNVVHVAIFAAIAVGWWRTSEETMPLVLGGLAVAGTILSAAFVYFQTMREDRDGPLFVSVSRSGQSRLSRVADALARRDFIYFVVLLSVFGKARWFLVLSAIGTPVFFLILVGIAIAGRPGAAQLEGADRSFS